MGEEASATGSATEAGRNTAWSMGDPVSFAGAVGASAAGTASGSLGFRSSAAGETDAEDGQLKLNADESPAGRMLSAGRAGTASAVVTADAAAAFPLSPALGAPLAEAS